MNVSLQEKGKNGDKIVPLLHNIGTFAGRMHVNNVPLRQNINWCLWCCLWEGECWVNICSKKWISLYFLSVSAFSTNLLCQLHMMHNEHHNHNITTFSWDKASMKCSLGRVSSVAPLAAEATFNNLTGINIANGGTEKKGAELFATSPKIFY